jgi:hypothetical protein
LRRRLELRRSVFRMTRMVGDDDGPPPAGDARDQNDGEAGDDDKMTMR